MIQVNIGENKEILNLKEYHDFEWLNQVEIFKIFDQQDSGNISFGIIKNNERLFIKYAGARNLEYKGSLQDAVQRLKNAEKVYEKIHHPTLIPCLNSFETKSGYGLTFKWVEGECMHNHWDFTPYDKYHSPDSPFVRLRSLTLRKRLRILTEIFEFARYVEDKGYVMIDFYDGSILYNFKNDKLYICDIDFFKRTPVFNKIGKDFWGSERFKSPEEYKLNAEITSATNVYTLAGLAFSFIGGINDRSKKQWEGPLILYNICMKALEDNPENRFNTISDFYRAWKAELRVYL